MAKFDPKGIENILALTPLQEGMLFHYLQDPQSQLYFEQLNLTLSGEIDVRHFERAWNTVIETNEMLRTVFRWEKLEKPSQIILKEHKCNMIFHDLAAKDGDQKKTALEEIKDNDCNETFDLHQVPFRVILCKLDEKKFEMVVSNHHILYDGWSNGIILKEFFKAYHELHQGRQSLKLPIKPPFKEFIKWIQNQDKNRQEKFWREYLASLETPTEIPTKRRIGKTTGAGDHSIILGEGLKGKLDVFVKNKRVTWASIFYTAWGILLQKYCDSEDVIFGTTVSGRSDGIKGIEDMVGLFINTIPLRTQTAPNEKIIDVVFRTDQVLREREEFENTPLPDIRSYSPVSGVDSSGSLFDTIVVIENYPLDNRLVPGGSLLTVHSYSIVETTHYDLSVGIIPSNEIEIKFSFNRELFEKDVIENLAGHFQGIVRNIIENPETAVYQLEILSGEEKNRILDEFNNTGAEYPANKTIHQFFEEQVEKSPDRIALSGKPVRSVGLVGHVSLSYSELNDQSNRLAGLLIEKGVLPDNIVAIMVERSIEMVIGIFGILKSGGAYLPIDPGYPQERIAYMLKDSSAKLLVTTNDEDGEKVRRWEGEKVLLEEIFNSPKSSSYPLTFLPSYLLNSSNLAYLIYTSGSTGKPKGVMIDHHSTVNLLVAMQKEYPLTSSDTYLLKTSYLFDVSVTELFGWTIGGGQLAILEKDGHKDPRAIVDSIERNKVSHINFVPSMFNAFATYLDSKNINRISSLKYIFLAGEALLPEFVNKFRDLNTSIRLENIYGPTESSVYASHYSLAGWKGSGNIPIGRPMPNIRLYIFDRFNCLQPPGIVGELTITGVGLARGYLDNPELTAEKFKFNRSYKSYRTYIFYKTGDLARWLNDGNIEFLGRIDHQVKIRGFRIELGEIENLLLKHDRVKDAVVVLKGDETGDKNLAAYFVSDTALSDSGLRDYLLSVLPEYMIPAYFVRLEKIPLTPTGKVDRGALPAPEVKKTASYAAPRDEIEVKLAEIWAGILGRNITQDRIGIDDNFFRLGGHSLKATSLASRIYKEFNVKIPLGEIFKRPAIRGLSDYINEALGERYVSIEPVEEKEYYKLSSVQKRLYFLQQMNIAGTTYNISAAWLLEGIIDKPRLEQSIAKLIQRHESLRTSFVIIGEEPVQQIHKQVAFEIEELGVRDQELGISRGAPLWSPDIIRNFIRPFDLSKSPLMRAGLVSMAAGRHLLMVDMHHIISDGISTEILVREFTALYSGEKPLPIGLQYKDYAEWQNRLKQGENFLRQTLYWKKEFEGQIPVLELPDDYARPAVQSFEGDRVIFTIGREVVESLNSLAFEVGATLYMVLLAVYGIFLSKLSGQEDIIIGTPVGGRRFTEFEKIIGVFVNTLALRNYPVGEKNFTRFLEEVKETTLEAFENQDYQYEDLVEALTVNRDAGRNPLFDVMFVLQNMGSGRIDIPGLKLEPPVIENKTSKFDLTLMGVEVERKLEFTFEYCTKLFKAGTIERFIAYFKNIVSGILQDKGKRLSALEMITVAEKYRFLYELNCTEAVYPKGKTIHGLFVEQASKTPDHVAIIGCGRTRTKEEEDMHLSYRELNDLSNRLAGLLMEKEALPDNIVGIMVERSVEMVIGIFGILKVGGAYLPIDPDYPEERIDYMLKDSGAKLLAVANDQEGEKVRRWEGEKIILESFCHPSNHLKGRPRRGLHHSSHFAYIIYTSGSTGKSKGVIVEHNSVVNLLYAMQNEYPLGVSDTYLLKTSYAFDVSVTELFGWYLGGSKVAILEKGLQKDPRAIVDSIERRKVSHINFVPSMFKAFIEYLSGENKRRLSSLKYIFLAGEELLPGLVKKFRDLNTSIALENIYGPTESTVYSCKYSLSLWNGIGNVPIGKPLPNLKLYILNKYYDAQPVSVVGELCISGVGLALGYLNRPGLTAEKFVVFPLTPDLPNPGSPLSKLYKTGDLARLLPDGNIEFLGRLDQQVKIRGFRIELGEIESQLSKHPGIKEAIVIAEENKNGSNYLCAYIVCRDELKLSGLREYLGKQLPEYMIPSCFINLDKIPLTANGKIDRKALPVAKGNSLEDGIEYLPPRDAVEKILVEIWAKILGREKVGINQNFFAIGGDSIKAIQIISRMSSAGYKMEMKDLFQYPVISNLAPRVKKVKRIPDQSVITGTIPLTPIQEAFFNESHRAPHHYNQAVMLYSREGFDKEAIEKIFARIQEHHDALRMTYKRDEGSSEIIQVNHGLGYLLYLEEHDLRNRENCLEELKTKADGIQASINLEKGPLMKLGLFHLGDGDRLLIVAHHLIIDGVSWRILFQDIETLYSQYKRNAKLVLPSKTDSFKSWSEKLSVYANSKTFLKEKNYWQKIESVALPLIPKDFDMDNDYVKDTGSVSFTLCERETENLLTRVNETFGTEINDILLTALGMGIKKTFGQDRVLIALEGHGREEILEDLDISRTVGWFTSVYPVVLDISYADDPGRQIKEIKETLRRIPNKGVGYGILRYLTLEENKGDIEFKLKPQLSFNYLGQFDADIKQKSFFELAKESAGNSLGLNNRREYLLDVSGIIADDRLAMTISFNKMHFKAGTMATLIGNFESELSYLSTFCSPGKNVEKTPSDFTYKEITIDHLQKLLDVYPDVEDIYALSPMQEGMLFHALLDRSTHSYFEQTAFRLYGELDILLVEKSFNELVNRHDILRTAFIHEDSPRPVQVVLKNRAVDFYYEDISKIGGQREKEFFIKNYKEKDKQHSFDLSKDILMRVAVFRLNSEEYQFIWSHHHILMDGWCIGILNTEFFEIYTGYLENRPYRLPGVKPYRTYIQWLEKQDKEASGQYWENYLDCFEEQTGVLTSKLKKDAGQTGYDNKKLSFELTGAQTGIVNELAARNHVTLNTLTQSIWGILLGKYTGTGDVIFGAVVSGRPSELEGVDSMVGLFINTIPVRIRFEGEMKFYRLLQQVQQEALAGEPHHYHSLAEIQSRNPLRQNLIEHLFILENYPISEQIEGFGKEENKSNIQRLKLGNVEIFEQTNYDLNVILSGAKRLTITLQYNGYTVDDEYIKQVARHFRIGFEQVIENHELEVGELTFLSEEEKNRLLYEFNDTASEYPADKTIHQLCAEQAEKTPDHIAVVGEDPRVCPVSLTYRQLNEKASGLAGLLIEKGVLPDETVTIMMERSIDLIVGILGILKSGAAYLPINPQNPVERVNYMLRDSVAKLLVIANDQEGEKVRRWKGEKIILESFCHPSNHLKGRPRRGLHHSSHLAYVIYTSGSTGWPKGVSVEHKQLVNFLYHMYNGYKGTVGPDDRCLGLTNISFDVSLWEFFLPMTFGAQLVLLPEKKQFDVWALTKTITREKITLIYLPPGFLKEINELLEKQAGQLRLNKMLVGVEPIRDNVLEAYINLNPAIMIINGYGPTETTICASSYHYLSHEPVGEVVPIGVPLSNNQIILLDDLGRLVPQGIPGEICVSGRGVSRGYLNNPELTAEKYSPHPYFKGCRMYRSGDMARLLPDGNLLFIGRKDNQLKLRGYRIEPGEIENRLLKHPGIREAVVLPGADREGNKYLAAYFVSAKEVSSTELREHLLNGLPDYMIPSYFIQMEKLPLTANGKIDRKALPKPGLKADESYIPPRNSIEAKLVELWSEVLSKDPLERSIGIHDNFFQLGGHSLKATVLASKIHKAFDVYVPLSKIFKMPTVSSLSDYVRASIKDRYVSIEPVEKKTYYALSSAQKRLYILYRMDQKGVVYNIPSFSILEGAIDKNKLEYTFKFLIGRHESLRTSFHLINDEPVQKIHDDVEFKIEYKDLAADAANGRGQIRPPGGGSLSKFIQPFDLSQAPLLRVGLLKEKEDRYILMVDMHHIISDGVSHQVLREEFKALLEGKDLPTLRIQYKDFAQWQNSPGEIEKLHGQMLFWQKELAGDIPLLEIPLDYPRPMVQGFEGNSIDFEISVEETRGLKTAALQGGATLFMVLTAVVNLLLARLSGQEEIIIGTPVAGRRHPDLEKIIGMFINTLVLRNYLPGNRTFREFLGDVKERILLTFENQEYPFEGLVNKLALKRDIGRNPLFDVMFVLQNMDTVSPDLHNFPVDDEKIASTAKFDLTFIAVESGGKILFSIQYCTKLFKQESVERFKGYFKKIVSQVIVNPGLKLNEIEIILDQERHRVLNEFNKVENIYPTGKTIHQLSVEQVVKTPDHIALLWDAVGEEKKGGVETLRAATLHMTYLKLHEQSDRLAGLLIEKGVAANDIVGIMLDRSIEMMVGILGILKAGAAYMPLNPKQPEARTQFMLKDSDAKILLTANEVNVLNYHHSSFILHDSNHLAYIIYTSGSTGNPKGVPITHANFSPLIHWGYKHLGINENDRVIQNLSYYFDWSVWEIFIALTTGASLHMISESILLNPEAEVEFILKNAITVLHITPTQYGYLLNVGKRLTPLKYLFIGAEKLTFDLMERSIASVDADCRIFNMYGPTEATIISAVLEIAKTQYIKYTELTSVPIGSPAAGLLLVVLNNYGQLCPVKIVGELYIGGAGVANGYLNNPELTAERFNRSYWSYRTYIFYKTGDLARWLEDGSIEFLGRIDHQVKIRGYRIELSEIENRLLKHPDIQESVVLLKGAICAYVVSQKKIAVKELREYLARELPDYMIPSYFVQVEKMPLAPGGKIDTRALPEPGIEIIDDRPLDLVEEKLAGIWAELLGIEKDQIGVTTHFFEAGGHSLKAALLVSRIHKEFNVKVPLVDIFKAAGLRELANYIKQSGFENYYVLAPVEKKEYYPLSSAQKRLFFLQQMDPAGTGYNIPAAWEIAGAVDEEKLEQAFERLIQRHESLRTSFAMINGEAIQRVHDRVEFRIEYGNGQIRAFDLANAPLLRVGLKENLLMIDMHHIIADGISSAVLIKDFAAIYQGTELPGLTLHYKDYAAWQSREKREKQFLYWRHEFEGEIPVLELPVDYRRPPVQSFAGKSIEFETKTLALDSGFTLFHVLLAIYYIFLAKISGQEDIVIGAPVAGRSHADLEKIIGMFVNTLALRNYPVGEKRFSDFLLEVKENSLKGLENQDYPYEDILERTGIKRDTGRNPLFDAAFSLLNFDNAQIEIPGLKLSPFKYENNTAKFDLTLTATAIENKLLFTLEYCTKLFKAETMARFINYFKNIITAVSEDKDRRISEIEIITGAEKRQIIENFNNTGAGYPRDKTIDQLFVEQVEQSPYSIALIARETREKHERVISLTYDELNRQAGHLAGLLIEKGARGGDIVALIRERSLEMITGIYGILKAGCAYLPIDPDYPEERIDYMLKDSGAKLLSVANDQEGEKIILESFCHHSNQIAYVIYTSGSTGKPKGTMIEHHSVINRLQWMQKAYPIGKGDMIMQKTPVVFDVSVWELFWWGFQGAGLYLLGPGEEKDPHAIAMAVGKYRITTMHFVPSMLNAFLVYFETRGKMAGELKCLKQVFSSGEALAVEHVERFYRLFKTETPPGLINLYGPTEATVDVSYFDCAPGEKYERIPIGKPIDNIQLYVLNKGQGLQPPGISGELCIAGVGLARGYLNNPGLTAERFDFNRSYRSYRTNILYKTGDLSRWLDDGTIEFLGRIDHQVKIRGYRIELAELENQTLNFHPVRDAAAAIYKDNTGENHLALYITPDPEKAFTLCRLLELEKQKLLEKYLFYELPNGMPVFYLNRGETDFMYREIFENLSYLKQGIVLEQGACIVDVGANIGLFSLFVLQRRKDVTVYAFEPIPPIFEVLALNTSLYKGNSQCFQYGLADKEGEADFTYYPHATVLSGRFADASQEKKNVRSFMLNEGNAGGIIPGDQLDELLETRLESVRFHCRFKTLSSVFREQNIQVVDLLKIDVEKSEIDVLKGIAAADWVKIRQIAMEVHNVDGRLAVIIEILKQHGYEVIFDQDQELRDTDLYNIYARQIRWQPAKKSDTPKEPAWFNAGQLVNDTREFLKARLPGYMVPSFFTVLKEFPLTVNGKIDRKALPQPGVKTRGKYVAPGNPVEEKIAGAWKDILKLDRVDVNTSFFNLGGTSINIIQVNTQLKNLFNIDVPVAAMFEHSTVRTLSEYVMQKLPDKETPAEEAKNVFTAIHTARNKLKDRKKMISGGL